MRPRISMITPGAADLAADAGVPAATDRDGSSGSLAVPRGHLRQVARDPHFRMGPRDGSE